MAEELVVDVRPYGPEPAALQELSTGLLERPALRDFLGRSRHELLSVELV